MAVYLSFPPRQTCSPLKRTCPSESILAFTVAFLPHLQTDFISVTDSAISKSLRLPGKRWVRKSVLSPKQRTGTSKSMTICES